MSVSVYAQSQTHGCMLGLKGAFEVQVSPIAAVSEKALPSVSKLEVESDSPQALAAKSCLGHLALISCLSVWLAD